MNHDGAWAMTPARSIRPTPAAGDASVWRSDRPSLAAALRDLWTYREVLAFLVWRDLKVHYKQAIIGAGWAILQPLLAMVVFSIFLGGLAGVPSDGLPYPLFVLCGLLPWQLFAHAITEAGNSLIANQQLVTKVYFPRLYLPAAPVLASLADFGLSLLVLAGLMLWYGVAPDARVVLLLPMLLLALVTGLAVGVWLAAINLRYRDVRHALPFVTQLWFFATPVAYASSVVPEGWQAWYALNPLATVVDGFRWAVLGSGTLDAVRLGISVAVVSVLLVLGVGYFHKSERQFADVA